MDPGGVPGASLGSANAQNIWFSANVTLTQGARSSRCSTGVKLTDDIELISGGRFVTFSFRSFR